MDERLIYQLKLLDKYISILEEIAATPKEHYLKDTVVQGAAERYLQLAIETCLNIGNRILSLEQKNRSITAPETYADILEKLALIEVLPRDFADQLVGMAKFRNLLVHIYWEIDPNKVYDILINGPNDLKTFKSYAAKYIKGL